MQHEQIHTNLFPARKLKCIVPRHFSPAFRASGKTFRGSGKIPGGSGINSSCLIMSKTTWIDIKMYFQTSLSKKSKSIISKVFNLKMSKFRLIYQIQY
jgi:hypothetical protein